MADTYRVGIIGGSGYGGGELLRLLAGHPHLEVVGLAARTAAGQPLGEVFPSLLGHPLAGDPLRPAEPDALTDCDVVFLATPHEASFDLAGPLLAAGHTVADLSAAYRLTADAFAAAYGTPHPDPERTPAPYGLPELCRTDLPGAALIAVPGCYPTASALALAAVAEVAVPDGVVVTGMSGTSGAGRALRDDLAASHVMGSIAPYGPARHRHAWEIDATWARLADSPAPVTFAAHLVPMPRGLLVSVSVAARDGVEVGDVRSSAEDFVDGEAFCHLVGAGAWPATGSVSGSNAAHLAVSLDPLSGRITAACAIDNLGKGAAGQAIQATNVALGLPEGAGLDAIGTYP